MPLIVSIAGAHSGSGKTTLAERLIARLEGNWGAVKYTKTAFYTSITDDSAIITQSDKDTARLLNAGARKVIWVQSPPGELDEALSVALAGISDVDGIIVEGNSPIEFLDPDVILFIFGKDTSRIKNTAQEALSRASLVVYLKDLKNSLEKCLQIIMDTARIKKIEKRLIDSSTQKQIPCALARRIAEELQVGYKDVGGVADGLEIKRRGGGLGCF